MSEEPKRLLEIVDLGLSDYGTAYQRQRDLVRDKKTNPDLSDVLFLVEHPDVYTYGRKSKEPPPAWLPNVFGVERGGEVTFHNPGQLVGYPILALDEGERDVHRHLRRLEQLLIDVVESYGVKAGRREGFTGVWVGDGKRKIASLGVAFSGWVTYHGFALNVSNDLAGFSRISPCGLPSEVMTSLARETGASGLEMTEIKARISSGFGPLFERAVVHTRPDAARTSIPSLLLAGESRAGGDFVPIAARPAAHGT